MPAKKSAKKTSGKSAKKSAQRSSSKRELITPHKGDSRYMKRGPGGQFKESDDVGKSLKQDRARKAKTVVKSGYGDQGDQKKRSPKSSKGSGRKK